MASPSSSPETPRDDRRAHMGQDPVKAETAAGAGGDGAPEAVPSHTVEKWNDPRINIYRLLVTNYSFVIMGMSDACLGPLIPYIEEYYHVSYTLVSLLFLSSFVGYLVAALSNNLIHHHLGQRGVALIAPSARILGYVLLSLHLPFPALPPLMLLPGFGSGLEDSAWNAWIGNMESANELLGFLHGSYGLGATIGPPRLDRHGRQGGAALVRLLLPHDRLGGARAGPDVERVLGRHGGELPGHARWWMYLDGGGGRRHD
ncbi:hypothetical protein PG987_013496 [Apiospora arundinis]